MHVPRRAVVVLVAVGLALGACAGSTMLSLDVTTRTGYAVIVEQTATSLSIGVSDDRDATAGQPYDVTDAIWRIEDGPWNEPPVTCLGRGQRVELGIAQVQNQERPGLLIDRVVWVACLAPA
jgi:hypothetical protein